MMSNKSQYFIQVLLFLGILIAVNIISSFFYVKADMTEEKRYTLTSASKSIAEDIEDIVYIKVLLEGQFPAGFKRLQESVKDILNEYRKINPNIQFEFENPSEGTVDEINQRRKALADQGINPVNLRLIDNEERSERLIYPVAIVNLGDRTMTINLLENEISGATPEENLNNSISLLEYKFSNAFNKLQIYKKSIIMFTEGHGELDSLETMDFELSMRSFYNTGRLNLDNIVQISPEIDLLIIARPRIAFSEKDKFKIDQYIMNGGKVMFLMDKVAVSLDSLQGREMYVPGVYDQNLDDMLFKYGSRINSDLVMDLECTRIALAVGQIGNKPQLELFPWYYHPAVSPRSKHPIVKNLDRIDFRFPSSIDTIKTSTPIQKDILLTTSQYTRYQLLPVQLSFEILRYEPDPSIFDKDPRNLAVLLSGKFPSLYKGKVSESMLEGLSQLDMTYKESSEPTTILVVSDGHIIKNPVNPETAQYNSLGFNRFENYKFANKDFLINAVEYMLDERGVLEARTRDVKLRLLDTVRAKKEKTKWQLINIGLPIVLLLLGGLLFNQYRKRKYAS